MLNVLHINCNYTGNNLHKVMLSNFETFASDIVVFCPMGKYSEQQVDNLKKNEVITYCFDKWDKFFFFNKNRKIYRSLKESINDLERFNVIHAFTLYTDGYLAYRLHKKTKIPYVVAIRDTDVNTFFKYKPYLIPLGIRIIKNAAAICFLSTTYRDYVIKKIVPEKYRAEINNKCIVVPNGIDNYWFDHVYTNRNIKKAKEKIDNRNISVVCVGAISKRKNIPMVQQAIDILRKKGWSINLNFIGKIEDISEYNKLRLDKYNAHVQPVNKEKLIEFYRDADIFVLVSHTETFGLVYAEALSQSLPVIYTHNQGFDGQFAEGEVGYSVNENDEMMIAEAIEKVCCNYEIITGNAIRGVNKFRWESICAVYQELYEDIVDCALTEI